MKIKEQYFVPGYFDSQETQIQFDVTNIKQALIEVKIKIEVKEQMGTMSDKDLHFFNKKFTDLKQLMRLFNSIPLVKFYKRYRYFKYPKGKAFQDVNYN